MTRFREFFEKQESILSEQDVAPQTGAPSIPTAAASPTGFGPKGTEQKEKWSASKTEILNFWKTTQPNRPIMVKPISYEHKGSTYGEDGIRITGSPQFITSVISHLKDFLSYETTGTKLAVSYRETESPSKLAAGQLKTSFVFYIAVKERGAS